LECTKDSSCHHRRMRRPSSLGMDSAHPVHSQNPCVVVCGGRGILTSTLNGTTCLPISSWSDNPLGSCIMQCTLLFIFRSSVLTTYFYDIDTLIYNACFIVTGAKSLGDFIRGNLRSFQSSYPVCTSLYERQVLRAPQVLPSTEEGRERKQVHNGTARRPRLEVLLVGSDTVVAAAGICRSFLGYDCRSCNLDQGWTRTWHSCTYLDTTRCCRWPRFRRTSWHLASLALKLW